MRMAQPRSPRGERGEDGAVIVEFAVVFMLFIMLVWGLITYGVIFAVQQSLTHASAEAARAASGISDQTAAEQRAWDVLNDQLSWLGGLASAAIDENIDIDPCGFAVSPDPDCLVVVVTYDWDNHAIVPAILDVATPDTLTARALLQHG